MNYGAATKQILEDIAAPAVGNGPASVKEYENVLYVMFQTDSRRKPWPAGESKIKEGLRGKCSAPTYQAVLTRAQELGLIKIHIECRVQRMLATDPEFFQPQTEAISNLTSPSWGACNYKRGRR